MQRYRRHHQRVAVGRRLQHELGGEVARAARLVLDHDRLAELFAEPVSDEPRHDVGGSARRVADEDLDGFVGPRGGCIDGERGKQRGGEADHFPLNCGFLFSMNARRPSM